MAGIARPFIPWIGSKEKLIPYIWQVFPPNPKLYLEPFGGGGALLLGIQPKVSRMDIYNDFNCDLVNLFLCARECTIQLVQELKFLPLHSRAEFDLLKEFMRHKELLQQRIVDERNAVMECFTGEEREELLQILRERSRLFDVQRAAAYYKVCRGSFSGTTSSFGVRPNNLTNFLYLFDDASKRLQDVIIENKDCLDIIRERDGPDSLIYCDPPYFDAESLYAVDFPKEKHEELHHILSQCKGYIVVSYNDCPFIRGLYGDFFRERFHAAQALRVCRKKRNGCAITMRQSNLRGNCFCGMCGGKLRSKEENGIIYWVCKTHSKDKKSCANSPVQEKIMEQAFCRMYYKLKHHGGPIFTQMLSNLQKIRYARMLWSEDVISLNKKISDTLSQVQFLTQLQQTGGVDPDTFISSNNKLSEQLRRLKQEKARLLDTDSDDLADRTRDLMDALEDGPDFLDGFDAELFDALVDKIIVDSNERLRFRLKNGLELTEQIERTKW